MVVIITLHKYPFDTALYRHMIYCLLLILFCCLDFSFLYYYYNIFVYIYLSHYLHINFLLFTFYLSTDFNKLTRIIKIETGLSGQ